MTKYRNDPDCEENQAATKQAKREVFALCQQAARMMSFIYPPDVWLDTDLVGADVPTEGWQRYVHAVRFTAVLKEAVAAQRALGEIEKVLAAPAGNRHFMQIAGPARQCLNIIKECRRRMGEGGLLSK